MNLHVASLGDCIHFEKNAIDLLLDRKVSGYCHKTAWIGLMSIIITIKSITVSNYYSVV